VESPRILRPLFAALLFAGGAQLASAQEIRHPSTGEAKRVRWDALSDGEKKALRERYDQFRHLPREEQERLQDRSRRLRDLRERMEALLPPDVAERLRALPPRERFEALRAALETHLGERRDLLRRFLPADAMESLKPLPSPERARQIRVLLREAHGGVVGDWLRGAAKFLPPGEVERIRALPAPDQFREMMRLRKDRAIADLEAKPDFFDRMARDRWDQIKALPPHEFFSRLGLWRAGGPERLRMGPGRGLPPFLLPAPEERARLDRLPPEERRTAIERIGRQRLRTHLRDDLHLPAEEIERIANLPFEGVWRELRRLEPDRFPRPPASRPGGR
jgi:hypothetical protein